MTTVFLSYSPKDHFFAELADIKLAEAGIKLWRDEGQLRAGSEWRYGIERGISENLAVLVALSANSAESSYVTFEWAYALGKGKAVIPLKLTDCSTHPKLKPIQYLDFSVPGALPWASLIERIREIETTPESGAAPAASEAAASPPELEPDAKAIIAYLDQRGYQVASYNRLRVRVDPNLSDDQLNDIVKKNPNVFRHVTIAGGKPGIAKIIP